MERLQKLLFELSSNERMSILLRLKEGGLRLTDISKAMGISPPEASRHLQRLSESQLIGKDGEGLYHLTPYGELTLIHMPALDFFSKNRTYLNERNFLGIPYEFIERMGELANAEFEGETANSLNSLERNLDGAKDFIYIISNDILTNVSPFSVKKKKMNLDVRAILPKPAKDATAPSYKYRSGVQFRFLENIDILVIATDYTSGFGLPDKNGRFDYTGFRGTDPKLKKWCLDLFQYYWDRSKPLGSIQ